MHPPDARAEAAGPPGPSGLEPLTTLARAILALVEADTDDAVLRAVASVASAYGPSLIRLYSLRDDPAIGTAGETRSGARRTAAMPGAVPTHAELASVWQAGVCPAEDPLLGRPFALADHPVLARWLAQPTQPLVLHDLSADPRAGAQHERSAQALVVLPLRVGEPSRWPGVLVLSWKIVHIPGPRERLAYGLLARVVASLLADRDALRACQRALDEANAVHVVALALAEAAGLDDVLSALAEPAQAIDASSAALWLRDPERPELLVLRAGTPGVDPDPDAPADPAPTRPLAQIAGLFARANEPWLFEQVRSDTPVTVEAGAPSSGGSGLGATLLLPLAWNRHEAALVEIGWSSPRPFPPGLRRLYSAVAGPAAIALSGDLLLAAAAREGAEFASIPAGVLVVADDAVSAVNPAGEAILARGREAIEQALRGLGAAGGRVDLEFGPEGAPTTAAIFSRDGRLAVILDTTAQTRAERARLRARDNLLQTQSSLQARRAVPAIALADAVCVVPVVGGLDGYRAQQLAEVLAAVPPAPRTVILDFTGTRGVEADAGPLVRDAARALAARGVAVTLSGAPEGLADGLELERAASLGEAIAAALVAVAVT